MENEKSELLESIRIAVQSGELKYTEIAEHVGMTKQATWDFIHKCRGTQVAKVEQILDVLGYEIVLRRKEKRK